MIRSLALAGLLGAAFVATASAQVPQIPTPVNPRPANPVATDGTPLPLSSFAGPGYNTLQNGRSVGFAAPVLGSVGGIVDGGLGLAGSAIDGVGNVAGSVVGNTLGAR